MKTKTLLSQLTGAEDMSVLLMPHGPYWAIHKPSADQILGLMRGTSVNLHLQHFEAHLAAADPEARAGYGGGAPDKEFEFRDGIAYLSCVGPMTKAESSWSSGCSTVRLRRQVRAAAADPEVKGIFLRLDSPGGSVSGTNDLARDVEQAARRKPVYAYAEDYCCSAAYWVASQATKIYANETALVGSIGTLLVVEDWSKLYEESGVEVLVFATGEYKGAGVPGTEITKNQRADFQQTVDDLNEHFLAGVARGRHISLEQVREIADGRVHIGEQCLALGLVDAIGSFDDCLQDLMDASRGAARPGMRAARSQSEERAGLAVMIPGSTEPSAGAGEAIEARPELLIEKAWDECVSASEQLRFMYSCLPDYALAAKEQLAAAIDVVVRHETVSGEEAPRSGLRLAVQSEAVLTAVRGLAKRCAKIAAHCEAEERPLNKATRSHIENTLAALTEELLPAMRALLVDPEADAKKDRLASALRRAEIGLLLSKTP